MNAEPRGGGESASDEGSEADEWSRGQVRPPLAVPGISGLGPDTTQLVFQQSDESNPANDADQGDDGGRGTATTGDGGAPRGGGGESR
jgi:hypothetical protein